jgi:hypothetical protein
MTILLTELIGLLRWRTGESFEVKSEELKVKKEELGFLLEVRFGFLPSADG